MIKTMGASSHGKLATVWMLIASCRSTPQLTTGGRRPMPRNESEVSPRIMVGTEMVRATMTWLVTHGSRCRKRIRECDAPMSRAAMA